MKSTLVYNNLHKIVINYPAVDKAMNLAAVVSSLGIEFEGTFSLTLSKLLCFSFFFALEEV